MKIKIRKKIKIRIKIKSRIGLLGFPTNGGRAERTRS